MPHWFNLNMSPKPAEGFTLRDKWLTPSAWHLGRIQIKLYVLPPRACHKSQVNCACCGLNEIAETKQYNDLSPLKDQT